jgi:hypothetical protein
MLYKLIRIAKNKNPIDVHFPFFPGPHNFSPIFIEKNMLVLWRANASTFLKTQFYARAYIQVENAHI